VSWFLLGGYDTNLGCPRITWGY